MVMIKKPIHRYGALDAGNLVKLFRQPGVYLPSSDGHADPAQMQEFIDTALSSPLVYILGQ